MKLSRLLFVRKRFCATTNLLGNVPNCGTRFARTSVNNDISAPLLRNKFTDLRRDLCRHSVFAGTFGDGEFPSWGTNAHPQGLVVWIRLQAVLGELAGDRRRPGMEAESARRRHDSRSMTDPRQKICNDLLVAANWTAVLQLPARYVADKRGDMKRARTFAAAPQSIFPDLVSANTMNAACFLTHNFASQTRIWSSALCQRACRRRKSTRTKITNVDAMSQAVNQNVTLSEHRPSLEQFRQLSAPSLRESTT